MTKNRTETRTQNRFLAALAPAAILALILSGPAAAAPKPYEPLKVTYDTAGADDSDLKALIAKLRTAVQAGDVATLKAATGPVLVIYAPMIGFPDGKEAEAVPDPEERKGPDRLDQAALLMTTADMDYDRNELDGMIVDLFGNALDNGTVGHSPTAHGALCAPAEPIFDRAKALAIADAADVPPSNLWILSEATEFHEKPSTSAPVLSKLDAGTVVPFIEGSVEGGEGSEDWYSVALPDGRVGYASNDISLGFQAISICFDKVDGQWAVTGAIVPGI